MAEEEELVLAPALFESLKESLPRISGASIQLKRGSYHNELTRFRYDVTLDVSGGEQAAEDFNVTQAQSLEWRASGLTLQGLRELMQGDRPELIDLTGVPNSRLREPVRTVELLEEDNGLNKVADIREALSNDAGNEWIDPEEVRSLAEGANYTAYTCVIRARARRAVLMSYSAATEPPVMGFIPVLQPRL